MSLQFTDHRGQFRLPTQADVDALGPIQRERLERIVAPAVRAAASAIEHEAACEIAVTAAIETEKSAEAALERARPRVTYLDLCRDLQAQRRIRLTGRA